MVNDQAVTPSASPTAWHATPPSCYASRQRIATDDIDEMACEAGWCATLMEKPYHEVCSPTLPECRAYIEEEAMQTRVENRFYWNLHVFPSIVFHPRHHTNGRIMKEINLTEPEAIALRKQAVDNPTREDLKPYLNPVLDDSASVYFSGQFLTPLNPAQTWSISLSIPPSTPGATSFAHDPPVMFRIPRMPGPAALDRNSTDDVTLALQSALLRPFAKDSREDDFVANLDRNCPFWKVHDDAIGQRAFTVRRDVTATLPDDLPTDPYDTRWKTTETQGTRTVLRDARTLENQLAIVRNRDLVYSDYWWKGCPVVEEGSLRMTKKQAMDFLTEPIPTCNLEELSRALYSIYTPIYYMFHRDGDERENHFAWKRMTEVDFYVRRAGGRLYDLNYANCPETRVSRLLRGSP